jgi:hypothetical protein
MQRAIEATTSKEGKGPLCVEQKTTQKPQEKASSKQPIIKEDVFVAPATQPDLNEPTGYARLMTFSKLGCPNPWWSVV